MTSAREIAQNLGGQWRGKSASVCCPAHDDKSPSLSISETRDGRPLVFCHAGCGQHKVIDALRAKGLWEGDATGDPSYPGYMTNKHDGHKTRDDRENQKYAQCLWENSDPIKRTLAETYLVSRGIKRGEWPDSLGFMPSLKHKPSGLSFPAMISAVTDNVGKVVAVQRTWLEKDGTGKAPIISGTSKMTLGPMGRGSVRLSKAQAIIGIAEGVETALSARQIYQIPVWASLSANRLGNLEFPPIVESLVIFADHGKVGMSEACSAAEIYERRGLPVDVMPPSVHFGQEAGDFNDVVRSA